MNPDDGLYRATDTDQPQSSIGDTSFTKTAALEVSVTYQRLLTTCLGNHAQVERLIAYEARRYPNLEVHELVERVLITWETDHNRYRL